MNLSRPFIMRPVATGLLMVALLLTGMIAYRLLPVSALPQVDYPTIQVLTFYPGASPDVMSSSVTAPLERQFGQMPGLNQMTSASSGGASVITLQFSLDLSLDVAEQEVQAAINSAFTFLPKDLPNPPVYSKVNPADAPVLTLALTSTSMPLPEVEDLADTRIAQKISQLPGVGLVSIGGGQRPAVRVQANPTALASYDIGLEDIRAAIAAANVNQAKGTFDGERRAYTIGANDQTELGLYVSPVPPAYALQTKSAFNVQFVLGQVSIPPNSPEFQLTAQYPTFGTLTTNLLLYYGTRKAARGYRVRLPARHPLRRTAVPATRPAGPPGGAAGLSPTR